MTVRELKEELLKIESENPNIHIDEMEIGPIFSGPTLMMTSKNWANFHFIDMYVWIF